MTASDVARPALRCDGIDVLSFCECELHVACAKSISCCSHTNLWWGRKYKISHNLAQMFTSR